MALYDYNLGYKTLLINVYNIIICCFFFQKNKTKEINKEMATCLMFRYNLYINVNIVLTL